MAFFCFGPSARRVQSSCLRHGALPQRSVQSVYLGCAGLAVRRWRATGRDTRASLIRQFKVDMAAGLCHLEAIHGGAELEPVGVDSSLSTCAHDEQTWASGSADGLHLASLLDGPRFLASGTWACSGEGVSPEKVRRDMLVGFSKCTPKHACTVRSHCAGPDDFPDNFQRLARRHPLE